MEKAYSFQNITNYINPIAFKIGFISVEWYSLMYVVAFLTIFLLLFYRIKQKENLFSFNGDKLADFLIYSFFGVIVGGRLGYVLYDFSYFCHNPLLIFSPFDFKNQIWIGIYGMSFHGGVLGVLISSFIYSKKNKIKLLELADFVVPAIPAGYFFGRIGNFLNLELYGKKTNLPWGINFGDGFFRHPTQLYEALGEGIILFIIFWSIRNKKCFRGKFLFFYLISYAIIRFSIDFLREPDGIYSNFCCFITWSQFLSLSLFLLSMFGLVLIRNKKNDKIFK